MDGAASSFEYPELVALRPFGMRELWFSSPPDWPMGAWNLSQDGHAVGFVTHMPPPASVITPGGRWNVTIQQGFTRWRAEFAREGNAGDMLVFTPRGLRGGDFTAADTRRYRLRFLPWRGRWTLLDEAGDGVGASRAVRAIRRGDSPRARAGGGR